LFFPILYRKLQKFKATAAFFFSFSANGTNNKLPERKKNFDIKIDTIIHVNYCINIMGFFNSRESMFSAVGSKNLRSITSQLGWTGVFLCANLTSFLPKMKSSLQTR
jgi:hypothetical protein